MPRPCGPCGDERRNEIDRRLLEMDLNGEAYRTIAHDFGFSVDSLKRHKANHLTVDLGDVRAEMERAKKEALQEVHDKELAEAKIHAANSMAARLNNATTFIDQLQEIRNKAADLLDKSELAGDTKAYGSPANFLKELRELIRLTAELQGSIPTEVNLTLDPQWIELRTLIADALESYPLAQEAVLAAIRGR